MDYLIHLKDLREHMTKYAQRVAKGHSFIVTKRSRPLFRISPIDDGDWETVIDFTQFSKGGIPAKELLNKMRSI